jgi:hypothetical protein
MQNTTFNYSYNEQQNRGSAYGGHGYGGMPFQGRLSMPTGGFQQGGRAWQGEMPSPGGIQLGGPLPVPAGGFQQGAQAGNGGYGGIVLSGGRDQSAGPCHD